MDSKWRYATDTASLWRKCVIVSATFGAAELVRYYLNKKRKKDLPEYQRNSIAMCGYAYATQVALKMFYIQNTRPIPTHELFLFPLVFPVIWLIPAYFAKPFDKTKHKIITMSNVLFASGLGMLIASEYGRKVFKSKPENKGKLYTTGFNAYSRHPNYLAESLLFTGWSLLSNQKYLLLYPLIMTLQFYGAVIPEIEQYLQERYSNEWPDYEKNVKALIPFLY